MPINHTPFPALAFEATDQYEQNFQVFVLRQTLDFSSGELDYADEQAPLSDQDRYFEENLACSVRQESDYCAFKPKCDVIVNGVAYAPGGKPSKHFLVCLKVSRDDRRLIEKVLLVTGERHFKKKNKITRFFHRVLKWTTLYSVRLNPWKLTSATPFTSLPLRAEYAYGGQCRIYPNDASARRLSAKYRLSDEQLASHPAAQVHGAAVPIAHSVYERNSVGRGYAPAWYLKASRTNSIAAPRIEYFTAPMTARQFWKTSTNAEPANVKPAGLNIRSKLHPDRRRLLGKVDEEFVLTNSALPIDFDFSIWNSAPEDQQTDFVTGGDVIELINLVPPGTTGSTSNSQGSSVLRLVLPKHQCFVRMDRHDGSTVDRPLAIDTVLVEPEDHTLTLVWRAAIPSEEVVAIGTSEFRMRSFYDRDRARFGASDQVIGQTGNEFDVAVAR